MSQSGLNKMFRSLCAVLAPCIHQCPIQRPPMPHAPSPPAACMRCHCSLLSLLVLPVYAEIGSLLCDMHIKWLRQRHRTEARAQGQALAEYSE